MPEKKTNKNLTVETLTHDLATRKNIPTAECQSVVAQEIEAPILEDLPLDTLAEKALREAVAEAIAEHKLRGHPIVIWRDGKVVVAPPEDISVKE